MLKGEYQLQSKYILVNWLTRVYSLCDSVKKRQGIRKKIDIISKNNGRRSLETHERSERILDKRSSRGEGVGVGLVVGQWERH